MVVAAGACRDARNAAPADAAVRVEREGEVVARFDVEVARTPSALAKGLMGVERLERDRGIVFLFSTPTASGFWMKNTLIPLDIAFWDDERKVISVLQMQPCRRDPCPTYSPGQQYVGALEVNLGMLRRVRTGDTVNLVERGR